MTQQRFDIYFAGDILPDHAADTVKQWLGKQFKLQGQALERLFSGQAVRIKQGVDMDTAGRYRAAFRKAGALVEIRPTDADPIPNAAPPGNAADTDAEPQLLPANTGTLEDCAPRVDAAELPDISHMDLAAGGSIIDDTPSPPAARIDTSHLSAEPAHSGDLSDCAADKPAQPIPDISRLQIMDD